MENFSDGKTSKFLEAINKYAEEQRNKLSEEAQRIKEAEKIRIEDEILSDAYHLIRKEMSEMRIAISSDRSKKEIESRKKLFDKRREIVDKVFSTAKNRLCEYVKTDEYVKFLEESARRISKTLKQKDVVIFVRDADKNFSENIKNSFGRDCCIDVSDQIEIGGLKAVSKTAGMIVDETLDERLASQHEWFVENSGLSIG